MEEWLKLPLTQLKRLVKSRAGRIAELQMEIKIIEGIIESKIREGDLGYSKPEKTENPKKEKEPEQEKPEKKKELKKDIKPSSNHSFEELE
jgi:hypothetical protein